MRNLFNDYQEITIPRGTRFLSDVINELPQNALFNKGLTGAGGTYMALTSEHNYIVAVPYTSLIVNKTSQEQHVDVLGVYGGISVQEIREYILSYTDGPKKIMVTYDSLPKVIAAFENTPLNVFTDCRLLIDEYHVLFNQYCFRNQAVTNLLKIVPNFQYFTYMTATPIDGDILLEELKNLPVIKAVWEGAQPIDLKPLKANNPRKATVHMCKKLLDNDVQYNLHFFFNSVDGISTVVKTLIKQYGEDVINSVKVVCSYTEENKRKLTSKVLIQNDLETPRRINFYTSKVFEGCDIMDADGKIVIVSDKSRKSSLLDIQTQVIQIAGRIRNTGYKMIHHIFNNNNRYNGNDLTLEEYQEKVDRDIRYAMNKVNRTNSITDEEERVREIKSITEQTLKDMYLSVDDNKLIFDPNLAKVDMENFRIIHIIYKRPLNLIKEYDNNGVQRRVVTFLEIADDITLEPNKRLTFKERFQAYCELRECSIQSESIVKRAESLENSNPYIKDAYEKLGKENVERLEYKSSSVVRELTKMMDVVDDMKVFEILQSKIIIDKLYTTPELEEMLGVAYNILEINKTPRLRDIKRYYDIKSGSFRVNGSVVRRNKIIRTKILITQ